MILYTYDNKPAKSVKTFRTTIVKNRIIYAGFAAFCLIFAIVYEHFSHEVYSLYMILAFLIPMAGGIISELYLRTEHKMLRFCSGKTAKNNSKSGFGPRDLLAGAVIWLTLGSIYKGVLEIYGTTNRLTSVFLIAGLLQVEAFIVYAAVKLIMYLKSGRQYS